MTPDYDILIAGAGPAGCAAAYDLARAGRRVLLLDKRTFPRDKACACGLTRKTLDALRYSVDPIVERVCHEIVLQPATGPGAPSVTVPSSRVGSQAGRATDVRVKTRTPICATAVRSRFDDFCLQQTLAAGAVELRKIDSIVSLSESEDGIELTIAAAGQHHTLRAPVLIGADGSNGQTRRLLLGEHGGDAAWYEKGFALEATVPYTVLPARLPAGDDPHDLVFDFAPLPGGYGWLFPKGDHINIGVGAFAPDTAGAPGPDSRTRVSTNLKSVTRQLLLDYTQQKLGLTQLEHITGQHLGMGGHAYVPRGRVLLVGDAAGLVDPLTGEGIHSAIVSGQAAAAAVLETLPVLKGTGFSPFGKDPGRKRALAPEGVLAAAYARNLRPLQQTLAFSHRAARAFYKDPARGFKAMRIPALRSLILKTYADGLPHTRLLSALAKLV
jgi:geranylgeranyl reductase family protein